MDTESAEPLRLATPQHRLAAVAVDCGLSIVTFNIGWFIWNLVTMAKGQSPGKQLLKVRVLAESTKSPASWGHMAIRQFFIPLTAGIFFLVPYYLLVFSGFDSATTLSLVLIFLAFAIYVSIWIIDVVWILSGSNRRLLDYWAKTVVINESR
jgi:uncharacterized RDD family membrane protein YckC